MPNGKNGKNGKDRKATSAPKNGAVEAAEDALERFSRYVAVASGRPSAFVIALALVLLWAATGPLFGFDENWQMVINTGTTIITFLMVFLLQRAQNRDTLALQVKLAELIIAMEGAKNIVAVAEKLPEHELEAIHEEHFEKAEEDGESDVAVVEKVTVGAVKAAGGKRK